MNDTVYDNLRRGSELILPGLGALYFALGQIWGLPYGEEIVGTLAAISTFVGLVVVAARKRYNDVSVANGHVDAAALPPEAEQIQELRLRVRPEKDASDDLSG